MNDMILATNWEKVDKDDFYLTDQEWAIDHKKEVEAAIKLQKAGNLYIGYIAAAMDYCVSDPINAIQVFVEGSEGNIIMRCESVDIDNTWKYVQKAIPPYRDAHGKIITEEQAESEG